MVLRRDAVSLEGKVAVVTGGGAGIGRAVAAAFTEFGARVAIWDRDTAAVTSAVEEIGLLGCLTDVRDAEQVEAALAETIEKHGTPHILVNNAGGVFWSGLLETSVNGWEALIRLNLTQVLLCTQRVARAMVSTQTGGSIINIGTIEGVRAAPGFAAYAAAKAGVDNFTKTAALELAPHNIRVNGLAPDFTLTDSLRKMAPSGAGNATFMVPLPSWPCRRDGWRSSVSRERSQLLRDRTDAARRRRHGSGRRLVPPSRGRTLHTRAAHLNPHITVRLSRPIAAGSRSNSRTMACTVYDAARRPSRV